MVMVMVTIALLVFTGCEQPSAQIPVQAQTEGKVVLNATESKELAITVNSPVAEYLYKATPRFSGASSGTASEWSHLSYGGAGTIGLLTQGKWFFEVQGLNSSGTIITTGSAEAYIDAGKDNVVEVQMKTDTTTGKGSMSYAVWTQNVSAEGSVLKVYERTTGATAWKKIAEHSNNATEHVRFSGNAKDLTAGYHDILFMLYDKSGAVLGGEQAGIQIVAGHDTDISGIIEPSVEIGLDLTIKSMGYVHGLLDPDSDILVEGEGRDRVAYMERGDTITFTWADQADASSIPTEWIWAFDGELVPGVTGNSYTVKFDEYGEHELSVVGIRRDAEGRAWDAGSAVMRILVVRHICEISFLANGGFYSDGTDIYVISEDTTTPETRQVPGGQPYDGLSPQRTGYVLTGWADATTGEKVVSIAKDGTVTFLDGFVTKKDTRSLMAQWVPGEYTLTVIWGENATANGGEIPYSTSYQIACGDTLAMLDPNASRRGFIFHGFTTEENGRGETITSTDRYAWGRDKTIYANWEYIPLRVGFYKSYSDYVNGKNPYKSIEVGSDLRYGSLPQPLRQGKVFKGWAQPEDVNGALTETVDGHKYLTNALLDGRSFVEVDSMVRKYEDHVLVSVWGEGTIKISFDYANANLTQKGLDSIKRFEQDGTGTYYKMGALGTMYGALPFTDMETEVRDGWEFMGWYDSPNYSMRVYEVSAVTTMEDHVLYGKWEGKRLTISFVTGTSETFPTKDVRFNSPYGTLPSPTKPGYDFEGWWYNGERITADTYVEQGNSHVLTAKWKAKTSALTINPNGGEWTWPTGMTLNYDDTYAQAYSGNVTLGDNKSSDGLKHPVRYGYDFAGWYDNPAGSGDRYKGTTVNTLYEPQSLHAVWNAHRHRITFVYNWPKSTSKPATTVSDEIPFGTSYGTLPLPEYTGYTFNGWFTGNGSGEQVSSSTKYLQDSDISLYGKWSILKISVSFYDGSDVCRDSEGNALTPKTVTWGETYGTLPVPYKKGYRYTGQWKVVGVSDGNGNPVYINKDTVVTQVRDITLTPVWEPLKIFVAIPYDGEATEAGTMMSADWSQYAYRNITYGTSFENLRDVTFSNGNWSDTGTISTPPEWSKTGHYKSGWVLVVPGVSSEVVNDTFMLWDYSVPDSLATERLGNLNPNPMIWLIPRWKPNEYRVSFVNRLYSSSGITEAKDAPNTATIMATYMQEFGDAIGSYEESDWTGNWAGYMCLGMYTDAELTNRISSSSLFGIDIPGTGENITIYVKWMKVRVQYTYSVDSDFLYPADSPARLYSIEDMFKGTAEGQLKGDPGWYSFTGTVNDLEYTDGSVRIGRNSNDVGMFRFSSTVYGNSADYTFTVPTDMHIKIKYYEPPYIDYRMICSWCGGRGYTSLGKANPNDSFSNRRGKIHITDVSDLAYERNEETYRTVYFSGNDSYVGDYLYDKATERVQYDAQNVFDASEYGGCHMTEGHGCSGWPWRIVTYVTCPNCNGDYMSKRKVFWEEEEEYIPDSNSSDDEDDGHYDYYLRHVTEKCVCEDPGYANYAGSPGLLEVTIGTSLGPEYGELNIALNGTRIVWNGSPTQNAYQRCKNPSLPESPFGWDHGQYTDTCHWDNSYWKEWLVWTECQCSNCEGKRAVLRNGNVFHSANTMTELTDAGIFTPEGFYVKEGDRISVNASLKTMNSDTYIRFTAQEGLLYLTDTGKDFGKVTLAGLGDGVPRRLNYDNYIPKGGKIMTSGANSVTEFPSTAYYSYAGYIAENGWTTTELPSGSDSPVITAESNMGEVLHSDIDKTRPATFSCVTADGVSYSGTLGATGTKVQWTGGRLTVIYTPSSGGGLQTFTFDSRDYGSTADSPVKSLNLSFWIKD